jgi:hypothetical protein
MAPLVKATPDLLASDPSVSLSWKENPAAKKLLDNLVSILAEEYIKTAKEHPEIFSK